MYTSYLNKQKIKTEVPIYEKNIDLHKLGNN